MEFTRKAIKVGNSAGVILPRRILGSEVKVIVLSRPLDIKKESLKLLDDYFSSLLGIYIISYNPAEVLAITTNVRKTIEENNIKISLVPLQLIKRDAKMNLQLRKKLETAQTILNKSLLVDLKKDAGIKFIRKL